MTIEYAVSEGLRDRRPGEYSVLLRTFNSENTLPKTLQSLQAQSLQARAYVIVDSGSTDGTLKLLPHDAHLHKFVGKEYNYSAAINQGLGYVSSEFVLIISSHTAVWNSQAIQSAIALLKRDQNIGAAYFCDTNEGELRYELIDRGNFDGFNGLWNSCAVIRSSLLKSRPFRVEVFAAEDQEWARWWIVEQQGKIARFSGAGMEARNARWCRRKWINDYVSIAYFTNRSLLKWRNLLHIALDILKPDRLRPRDRLWKTSLLLRLVRCHLSMPRGRSRYF